MRNFIQILPMACTLIIIFSSILSYAQTAKKDKAITLKVAIFSGNSEAHVPNEVSKQVTVEKKNKSIAVKKKNYMANNQNISKLPVDITVQKIHPNAIKSEKSINQEINALKIEIKNNKSDKDYVTELKKQLITLESLKKYLKKNNLN